MWAVAESVFGQPPRMVVVELRLGVDFWSRFWFYQFSFEGFMSRAEIFSESAGKGSPIKNISASFILLTLCIIQSACRLRSKAGLRVKPRLLACLSVSVLLWMMTCVHAIAYFSGTISTNTTRVVAGSPYMDGHRRCDGELWGEALTINPGVIITFRAMQGSGNICPFVSGRPNGTNNARMKTRI